MYAERLKEIRKQMHYTVKEIAEILGIKERTYGSYERKENNVSIELVTSLCKNLNVNANWFCTGEGEMFNQEEFKKEDMNTWFRKMLDDELKRKGLIK